MRQFNPDWTFKFVTYNRRELNDYEKIIEVKNTDSYSEAINKAVAQLPLGQKGNIYDPHGNQWWVMDVYVEQPDPYEEHYFLNDEPE